MGRYKFFKKKTFENIEAFESRINEEASRGWKVITVTSDNGSMMAFMERER